jgi:hypothetical protein
MFLLPSRKPLQEFMMRRYPAMFYHESNVHKIRFEFISLSLHLEQFTCKLMKNSFRTIFLFFILFVFLAGTTGISFSLHECKSSNKRDVSFFPEILNNTVGCCCFEEPAKVSDDDQILSLDEPECCTTTHVYLKASFNGFPIFYQFTPQLFQKVADAECFSFVNFKTEPVNSTILLQIDHPPPRYGKILLNFLQQLKIPTPVS